MANVPWHGEVVSFVQELAQLLPEYGIACEHEHSNCLLMAHSKVSLMGHTCLGCSGEGQHQQPCSPELPGIV